MSSEGGQNWDPSQEVSNQQPHVDPSTQAAPEGQSGDTLGGLREQAQQKVDTTIDQFAGKVPGGDQVSQQAKDAASKGLDQLEQQGESQIGKAGGGPGGMLGGLFGGGGNQGDNQGGGQ